MHAESALLLSSNADSAHSTRNTSYSSVCAPRSLPRARKSRWTSQS